MARDGRRERGPSGTINGLTGGDFLPFSLVETLARYRDTVYLCPPAVCPSREIIPRDTSPGRAHIAH
jgi:hypothetical protein